MKYLQRTNWMEVVVGLSLAAFTGIVLMFLLGASPQGDFCYAETSCQKDKNISCQIIGDGCTAEQGHGWVECTHGDQVIEEFCPTYGKEKQ